MKDLFLQLPPFAPDYSGVSSALFELNGVIAIHDGTGCTGNYINHDEPRALGGDCPVFTTNLRETEVIFGDDEVLLDKIEHVSKCLDPEFIVLLCTPVPMAIGTDFRAIGKILHGRTRKKILTFNTNGICFYDVGQEMAWMTLAREFVKEPSIPKEARRINVLGATPLDLGGTVQIDRLRELLLRCGAGSVTTWGMQGSLEEVQQVGAAGLNLVIQNSALPAARYLKEKFGTPYLVRLPVGSSGEKNLSQELHALWGEPDLTAANSVSNKKFCHRRALVIHEQITANAWRECLEQEFGFEQVDVATYFQLCADYARDTDIHLQEEEDLPRLIEGRGYDVVLGDALLRPGAGACVRWIPLPHLAISGRLHWDGAFCSIGAAADDYLSQQLPSVLG